MKKLFILTPILLCLFSLTAFAQENSVGFGVGSTSVLSQGEGNHSLAAFATFTHQLPLPFKPVLRSRLSVKDVFADDRTLTGSHSLRFPLLGGFFAGPTLRHESGLHAPFRKATFQPGVELGYNFNDRLIFSGGFAVNGLDDLKQVNSFQSFQNLPRFSFEAEHHKPLSEKWRLVSRFEYSRTRSAGLEVGNRFEFGIGFARLIK